MDLFLNILLLTSGFIGALTAFGGETWSKGKEPVLKRITSRGWISIGCLLLALIVGIVKEVESNISNRQQAKERRKLEAQLQKTSDDLQTANRIILEMRDRVVTIPRQVYSRGQTLNPYEAKVLEQKLFGGDQIRYYFACPSVYLIVGDSEYHLKPGQQEIIIQGLHGVPMTGILHNRSNRTCFSKMNILSIEARARN